MEHRTLGRTGIQVSTLCLGTMMFGEWGNPDERQCAAILHRALDAGIDLVDTADIYSDGRSEEMVGAALGGRREDVVLATKFRHPMGPGANDQGASRRYVARAVEASLRRLRTDWIDLYQVHRPDPATDVEETLGALSDLVHQGKIRAFGTSTFPAEAVVEMQWASERRGLERPAAEQPPYSIFVRGHEAALLPTCARHGLGVLAWSPLNGGWLTGKYRRGAPLPEASRAARAPDHFDYEHAIRERKLDLVEELAKVAADAGCTLTHLAHAFVLAHPAVTSAVIGPRTLEQLDDVLAGAGVRLDAGTLDRIDAIVPPGTDVNPADRQYTPPDLEHPHLRRR
jgi:aryl-alcohol dehydrogenase-like predicted oxidoreductase